jgi:hypothetical protein
MKQTQLTAREKLIQLKASKEAVGYEHEPLLHYKEDPNNTRYGNQFYFKSNKLEDFLQGISSVSLYIFHHL